MLLTRDTHHLEIRLPEDVIMDFLDRFSNVPLDPPALTAAAYRSRHPWGDEMITEGEAQSLPEQIWVPILPELIPE